FVSPWPSATNIFLAAFSEGIEGPDPTRPCLTPKLRHSHSRIDKSNHLIIHNNSKFGMWVHNG
ncbi:MAG: hypothetical protein O4753_01895, partial [Trichodesmium sp. St7_bin2_1]|nr:hypothetical protein [Trichodesmium sp. St7_bin2_1]